MRNNLIKALESHTKAIESNTIAVNSKATGSNTLAKYIKNHPATTIPIFSVTLILAAYLNKWGYFNYFMIQPMYINVNFTQLLPNTKDILLWIIFLTFYFFILSIDRISLFIQGYIKIRKYEKMPDRIKYKYIKKIVGKKWAFLSGLGIVYLFVTIYTFSDKNYLRFAISLGCLSVILGLFLLFTKRYMITMLLLVCWICLVSYKYGYYTAATQKEFDKFIDVKNETTYVVVDYFEDKYIFITEDDLLKLRSGEIEPVSFEIRSIVNNPLTISR